MCLKGFLLRYVNSSQFHLIRIVPDSVPQFVPFFFFKVLEHSEAKN
ncbi:hypothetical protein SAMN05444394_2634 [Algoriphagus halophilus]|uniref:Uncharacterized protein n=1 Tax=Algoriphagus halophilus TaxID=226505 RepID=A0A1N6FQH6_9BACT|nr:hypothetical protein SAMN05444394_2634 [Algoriphagus halophilus]